MTGDTVFHKYMKIRAFGHEDNVEMFSDKDDIIHIEEKIDGANFRFMINNDKILFGSRNQAIGNEDNDIGGNWRACVDFIKKKITAKDLNANYIVYGECCVKHSVSYDWEKMPSFLGFDIFDLETDSFLSYDEKVDVFNRLSLPVVPFIKTITAGELVETPPTDEFVPQSVYYDGQAEGVVFKNYKKGIFSKYVTDKFKEKNKESFGGCRKHAIDDTEKVVFTYCTNARIEKIIFKLVHEGAVLDMPLMHTLPKMVYADMWEEHLEEIYTKDWTVNFRKVYRMTGKRCLEVLKTMITNNIRNSLSE